MKSLTAPSLYTSHDGETHTARIAQYFQAIKDGQIPPRIAPSLYNGLGSPIFVYIYPLPYFFGSAVHFLGISYVDSFKILMAVGFILSGIFSFLWLKEVFQSEKAAFLGALYYCWVPYRFLLIYVRGSVSELLAYTFLPLSFYAFTKLSKSENAFFMSLAAISLSMVLLSQNLVALITLPVLAVYIFLTALSRKSASYLLKSAISAIWAFLISAITYLPTLFERSFVRLDEIISVAFADHFVAPIQLIHSPWGYGFDLPGAANDQMSFQIGLAQILVFILAVFITIYLFIKRSKEFTNVLSAFFILVFIVSVFLMLDVKPNTYVWQHFKILHTIDLPWRFLGVVVTSTSFLAAFVAKKIKPGIVFIFLVLFVLVANRNHLKINQVRVLDDSFFTNYTGTATQYNEFTPKWRQTTKVPEGFSPNDKVDIVNGTASITSVNSNSKKTDFQIDVTSPTAQVRINKLYFPKTQITLDNKNLEPFKDVTVTDSNTLDLSTQKDASGLLQMTIPKGTHTIEARYQETTLRLLADFISAFSLLSAIVIILKNAKA